jgi:hypothetical protein
MDAALGEDGVSLTCRPSREGRTLVFDYTVTNSGGLDIYVQDALPSVDPATRAVRANERAVSIIHSARGEGIVGKFMPPMPTERRPAVRILPLAQKLPPGESMTRRLAVPEPLAETSPYLPDLLLRQYEMTDIPAVVFALGFWAAPSEGFMTMPAPYAPGLSSIVAGEVRRMLWQRFATTGLQIFRRTDPFPRSL